MLVEYPAEAEQGKSIVLHSEQERRPSVIKPESEVEEATIISFIIDRASDGRRQLQRSEAHIPNTLAKHRNVT